MSEGRGLEQLRLWAKILAGFLLCAFSLAEAGGGSQPMRLPQLQTGQTWELRGQEARGQSFVLVIPLRSFQREAAGVFFGNQSQVAQSGLFAGVIRQAGAEMLMAGTFQPAAGRGQMNDLCLAYPDARGYSGLLLRSGYSPLSVLMAVALEVQKHPLIPRPIDSPAKLKKALGALEGEPGTCTFRPR